MHYKLKSMHKIDYRRVRVSVQKNQKTNDLLQYLHSHHIAIYHLRSTKDALQFELARQHIGVLRKARSKYRVKLKLHYLTTDELLPKRLTTFISLLCLWLIPMLCNYWIWEIDVQATTPEEKFAIERLVQEEFAAPILKKSLPTDQEVREFIMQSFREYSWVHVAKVGSKMTIQPQLAPKNEVKENNDGYYHLIARNSGVITHFDIKSGERKVAPNTTVYKGDTLVSGLMVVGEKQLLIGAVGDVYADYWLESDFIIPLEVQYEIVTEEAWHITFANEGLPTEIKSLSLPDWLARYIRIAKIETREKVVETLTEEHIESRIMPLLHEKLSQSLPMKSRIKKENLLHIQFEGGKVKGKVLYLINENIAKPYPIH
ncbi:sporulation protein YqfD [Metasolibacillus meyeri]|uniref:Sporulation protein YqfD n=1 Tax=Metasolibacillus meyeri TaxID=1071052 RepID=A0AAW9NYC0_9BACL|nr:sporulation protein YqfD [Metasolibacillus meyeri]MEC1179920.1 sporulation protein YqfD [Metasolibacillus meyeri]